MISMRCPSVQFLQILTQILPFFDILFAARAHQNDHISMLLVWVKNVMHRNVFVKRIILSKWKKSLEASDYGPSDF